MTLTTRAQSTSMTKLSSDFRCHGARPGNKNPLVLADMCLAAMHRDPIFPRLSAALELIHHVR